jgi:hypothetical protein
VEMGQRAKTFRHPDIKAEMFFDYITSVFLRTFAELHALDKFGEETSVLLIDN